MDFNSIGTITESLTYNTYFRKWMLVGNSVGDAAHDKPPGVYYSLSDDLLNWTNAELLMAAEITLVEGLRPAGPDQGVVAPRSRTAPRGTSRPSGQRAQQFYTWYHLSGCNGTLDRDLHPDPDRVLEPAARRPHRRDDGVRPHRRPSARPSRSTPPGPPTPNGTVEKYQWDMDGDGKFERDTGKDPHDRAVVRRPPSR